MVRQKTFVPSNTENKVIIRMRTYRVLSRFHCIRPYGIAGHELWIVDIASSCCYIFFHTPLARYRNESN